MPRVLNYQGKLLGRDGVGIDDTLAMTFRLYTSELGGEPIWSETIPAVGISKGLFSVILGSSTPFPDSVDFSSQYWLEVEIAGERMRPRERLSAVPYAMYSARAENALISYSTEVNARRRRGENIVFRAGSGATLADSGSNIYITLGTCGGGGGPIPTIYDVLVAGADAGGRGITNLANPTAPQDVATKSYVDEYSVSSVVGGSALSPNGPSMGDVTLDVNVDNSTIEVNASDRLAVREGGITSREIATNAVGTDEILNGTITNEDISPEAAIAWSKIDKTGSSISDIGGVSLPSTPPTGGVFYYDGTNWTSLSLGSYGQVLTVDSTSGLPRWQTPAARAIYNFILSASPSSGRIPRGDSTTVSINATEVRGESPEYIRFYAAGLPTGATASFSPDSCQPSGGPPRACSSTMKIRTTGSASSGTYAIPITGVATGGATATAIYTANIGVPAKVTGVTVSGCYNLNRINITWSTPDDGGGPITHYNIYRSTSSGNEVYYTYVTAPTTTFRDTNVTVGTTYYYQVSAVNAVGEGDRSNEVNITATVSSPLASCKAILDAGCSVGDGVYTIDPDGVGGNAPFQAYCDMTTDGGGWTEVVRIVKDFTPMWNAYTTNYGTYTTTGTYGYNMSQFSSDANGEDLEIMFFVDGVQRGKIYKGVNKLAWDPTYGTSTFDTQFYQKPVGGTSWSTCNANLLHSNTCWNWSISSGDAGCAGWNYADGFILHGTGSTSSDTERAYALYGLGQYSAYTGFNNIRIFIRK